MSDRSKILTRGLLHSLTGFSGQIITFSFFVGLTRIYPNPVIRPVFWTSSAGIFIWLHLILTYALLKHEAHCDIRLDRNEPEAGESISTKDRRSRIRFIHHAYQRFLVPVLELGVAALLIQSTIAALDSVPSKTPVSPETNFPLIAIYSVFTFILIVVVVYLSALIKVNTWRLLKSGRNYMNLMIVMFCGLLAAAGGEYFGINRLTEIIGWGFTAVNTLLAAEVLLSLVLRWFAPRRPEALPRPAFEFYLLDSLSQPRQIRETAATLLEGVFGFDILQTSFGKVLRSLMLPAVFLTVLLLFCLSSVVIVKPYEQAVILNLGHLKQQPVHSGLHFKLPWPLASARHFNVARIRSIRVGSHHPDRTGGTIYREGVPILWTNMHGLTTDELLICSSPQDRTTIAVQKEKTKTDARKVPSVSLAGADVQVQFVIKDLIAYLRSSAMPDVFLRNVAEASASRFIYRYDIDALFCEERLALGEAICRSIQYTCDKRDLGIKIVHVAISAVHPPLDVAGAFEETVAAMQERETDIQYARQQAIRFQVETTGSTEAFSRLSALADSVDSGHGVDAANHNRMLHECGGEVSKILAEAESYRFSRESRERGKTDRFGGRLHAHAASPQNYLYDQYFSILEKGLADSKKVILLENNDNTIVRMGLGQRLGIGTGPEGINF